MLENIPEVIVCSPLHILSTVPVNTSNLSPAHGPCEFWYVPRLFCSTTLYMHVESKRFYWYYMTREQITVYLGVGRCTFCITCLLRGYLGEVWIFLEWPNVQTWIKMDKRLGAHPIIYNVQIIYELAINYNFFLSERPQ